jgi:hypothetical protein
MALRECRVMFRDVRDIDHSVVVHAETTMDAAALGLKRIREQQFVTEDLADPVTVELVTSTQHKVSLRKVMEWMSHAGGVSSPGGRDEGAGAGRLIDDGSIEWIRRCRGGVSCPPWQWPFNRHRRERRAGLGPNPTAWSLCD